MNIYNSNIHTKKSVYVTMKAFRWEPEWSQFNRVGQVITLHHCEMMRLITEYNTYLDRIVAPSGKPTEKSTCEEEDRPLSLLKAGTSKRTKKTGSSSSQVQKKIPKRRPLRKGLQQRPQLMPRRRPLAKKSLSKIVRMKTNCIVTSDLYYFIQYLIVYCYITSKFFC